ncbi:hypothetical protein AALP_AAs56901U000200 [Arabis alpina]|uniref:Uncharacterized protein n=2 Tax=Arabis alpina TaxID=50452 RepID=A0A087FWD2_ARAAL|nr:hypothetical protein AALP_AAs56901U000200 [Arabis alpina]
MGGRPEIDIAGEVPARQSGHTPPQRVRSTGGGSSYSSNSTSRSPPVVSRSQDSHATVSVSRTRSVPHQFGDTTNRLPFSQLTSRATSSDHLSNLNLNDQPRHQSSQSRHIEEEVENEDEEDEEEEEDADDFGDGEPNQAEEFDGYHEPEGLDDEQLLEKVLALPGRQRLPLLSERKYNWDIGITELVRAYFNRISTKQMRRIVSQVRRKGVRTIWIGAKLWAHMCNYWKTPEAITKSNTASNSRTSTRGGLGIYKHVSGQTSHLTVEQQMEEELGRPVSVGEVFVITHTAADGTFVDLKAKQISDAYEMRLAEVLEQDPGAGAEDPDLSSELSTHRNLRVDEKNQLFLKCTEFDQKGKPFGLGGLSQTFNKGKRKVQYATSSSAAVDLEELQEEMKSARQKIAEHDEEIRRRDEENKKRDEENKKRNEENQKRDEENRRRDAELLELRQSLSRVSEMEKLLSFLKKDDPRIAAYLDAANDDSNT